MSDWIVTSAPMLGLLVNALIQIGVAHSLRRVSLSIVFGACAGLVATIAIALRVPQILAPEQVAPDRTIAVLTYLAFAFGFWTFLNLNITSLRIRLLRELLSVNGGISRHELFKRYSPDEFLRRRLERLERGRQVSYGDGHWTLASRTYLLLARILGLARMIIMPSRREK